MLLSDRLQLRQDKDLLLCSARVFWPPLNGFTLRLEPSTSTTLTNGLGGCSPDPCSIQRSCLVGELLLSRLFKVGSRFFLQVFKMKAVQLAEKLLPAFNTPTGIPWAIVNLKRSVTPP